MTKEEILAMEAGAKLDAFVHVKVMSSYYPEPLHYSTDISAAFQVVEKMAKEGYYFGLYTVIEDSKIKWDCFISKEEMGELTTPLLEHESASEAICKAALLARLEVRNDR